MLLGLANAELNAGRPAQARPHYERCRELATSPVLGAYCNYGLGKALRRLGDSEASHAALEAAYRGVESRVTGAVFAEIAFAYAESLSATDEAHAVEIAHTSLDIYEAAGKGHERELAQIQRWLAER